MSCSKDKQSHATHRKTAELTTSSLLQQAKAGSRIEWPKPQANKSEIQVNIWTAKSWECLKRIGSLLMLLCVCERERNVPHRARGQWELIFLLSYPLASLALLAVRWWIHCFLKFVCNIVYIPSFLISQDLAPCFSPSLFFISQIACFFSFISPSLSHTFVFFFIFLLKSFFFASFCFFLITWAFTRAASLMIINDCYVFPCLCVSMFMCVQVCVMHSNSNLMLLVCQQHHFLLFPPSCSVSFRSQSVKTSYLFFSTLSPFGTRLVSKMLC